MKTSRFVVIASSAKERHNNDLTLQTFAHGLQTRIIQDPSSNDIKPNQILVSYGVSCPHNQVIIKNHIAHGGVWMPVDPAWLGETEGVARFTLGGFRPAYNSHFNVYTPSSQFAVDEKNFRSRPHDGYYLILPPTKSVADFFDTTPDAWIASVTQHLGETPIQIRRHPLETEKNLPGLQFQLDGAKAVIGFNSAIMVRECLEQGIPVAADPRGSVLGFSADFPPARPRVIAPNEANHLRGYLERCQATHAQIAVPGYIEARLGIQDRMGDFVDAYHYDQKRIASR